MRRCPLALWDLAVRNLHVLTTMLSFTVVWQIPDLPCWYQLRLGLNLDIFLFPVTTLNNFLYLATPQHSAVSIHQVDWPDTLGRIAPHPSPSCSHPMEVSWTSGNCRDYPSNQPPFANEPTSNRSSHRQ